MYEAKGTYTSYDSDEISVEFHAEFGRDDNLDYSSIQVLSLYLYGIPVSFLDLPPEEQKSVLDLYDSSR
jgi:hypothetical protein